MHFVRGEAHGVQHQTGRRRFKSCGAVEQFIRERLAFKILDLTGIWQILREGGGQINLPINHG